MHFVSILSKWQNSWKKSNCYNKIVKTNEAPYLDLNNNTQGCESCGSSKNSVASSICIQSILTSFEELTCRVLCPAIHYHTLRTVRSNTSNWPSGKGAARTYAKFYVSLYVHWIQLMKQYIENAHTRDVRTYVFFTSYNSYMIYFVNVGIGGGRRDCRYFLYHIVAKQFVVRVQSAAGSPDIFSLFFLFLSLYYRKGRVVNYIISR